MIIRPILFNTEMVQAIQEGRKTATRRLMSAEAAFACANHEELQMHVPFQAGDVLWVRESWFFPEDSISIARILKGSMTIWCTGIGGPQSTCRGTRRGSFCG